MLIKNSLALLNVFFISIYLGASVEVLDLNEGESCFINRANSTQQVEGICTKIIDCERPCSADDEKRIFCKKPPKTMPIVCCPLTRPTSSISATKCQEYKERACNQSFAANVMGSPQIKTKYSNCASTTQPVIVGGEEAMRREFPHMTLVGWSDGDNIIYGCGGTLISERFVLSAAHCFDNKQYGPIVSVRLGEHDKGTENESTHIDVSVLEVFPYPNYQKKYIYDDIGLIKLERKVDFTDAIRPACLPEESILPDKATATGWGYIKRNQMSSVLMKVSLKTFSHNTCSESYPSKPNSLQGIHEGTQFCAGSESHINNTCSGDSGGPLQIHHNYYFCTFTIVGVTSFGKDCIYSTDQSLGVYTRVFPYVNWIESIVWPESE